MKREISVTEFRDGIFTLRTRRFGEVAELMIKLLYKLDDASDLSYDKFDARARKRVEIKFSTVMKSNDSPITENNVIDQCLKANLSQRVMKYAEIINQRFDCNIQQVKTNCFDILYYGLFFADRIVIYKMTSAQVIRCKGYSNKQHRNNVGEGQFHINNETIDYHNEKYKVQEISYKQLLKLFE